MESPGEEKEGISGRELKKASVGVSEDQPNRLCLHKINDMEPHTPSKKMEVVVGTSQMTTPQSSSLSRRTRSQAAPDWNSQELLVLVSQIASINSEFKKTLSSCQKWKMVSENLMEYGFIRPSSQCRSKWNSLVEDHRKIINWEICYGSGSYWSLESERRVELKLPVFSDKEVFGLVDDVLKEAQMNVEVDNDPGDTIVVEDEKLPLLEFGSWNTTPSQLQKRNKEMMVQKWHMSRQLQRMSPKKATYTRRNVKTTERVKLLCKTQQLVECSMDTPALPWINETETMQETVQKQHENLYQLVGNSELIIVKPDDNITELGRDNAEPQIEFCEKTTAVNELQEIEQRPDMNLQRPGEDSEKVIQMDERLHENPHQDIEDSEQSITIKPENNNAEMAENLQENLEQQKEGSEEAKTAKPVSDDIVGVQEMALKLQENFKEASLARPQNDKREKLQEMLQRLQEKAQAVHAILSGELIDGSHDAVSMAMEMEFVRLQGDELIRILQDVVEMLGQYNRLIKEEDCSASKSKT